MKATGPKSGEVNAGSRLPLRCSRATTSALYLLSQERLAGVIVYSLNIFAAASRSYISRLVRMYLLSQERLPGANGLWRGYYMRGYKRSRS